MIIMILTKKYILSGEKKKPLTHTIILSLQWYLVNQLFKKAMFL